MKIRFFKPFITGNEIKYIKDLLDNGRDLSGDGKYTKKVHSLLEKRYHVPKVLLTTSGTTALEMAVRLLNLEPGDEIIAPSFTFSSTVNAILMHRGLKVKFAEIDEKTLNIDPEDIVRRISPKTRAIIVVHYAGVAADMDKIMTIAKKYNLKVIEDAAQAIESKYKNKYLGTIGDIGCLSFHDTKNITCGEGGAIFLNKFDRNLFEKAEIMREKGTDRSKFFRGLVDKYTWVDIGSSYLPSEILAAFLLAQLEQMTKIIQLRFKRYDYYLKKLAPLSQTRQISLPYIPTYATNHNAHIFYVIVKTPRMRDTILRYLKKHGIPAYFHYIPLHNSPFGTSLGYKTGDFPVTEKVSQTLLRLPLYSEISKKQQDFIITKLKEVIR